MLRDGSRFNRFRDDVLQPAGLGERQIRLRMVHVDEPGIRTVQIAGSVPEEMAATARINVESGAQIIDINMGCPAKR